MLSPPRGLEQIKRAFGDPTKYINEDGLVNFQWERQILGSLQLPAPLPLGWAPAVKVTRIRVHVGILQVTWRTLDAIYRAGLWPKLGTFDGAYAFRPTRRGRKLSTHAWGIALDLGASRDPQGDTDIDQDPEVVAIFEKHGWVWGGRWPAPAIDAQHFQFAESY